ncbi:MAG TPA: thiamine-phosphate kinase [Candidatus Obscuribacterales bacterium]
MVPEFGSKSKSELVVREIGEQGLLRRLQSYCPPEMVGDDAAVLSLPPDQDLVVTTDVLVDGVHFSLGLALPQQTTSPTDVGWRAIAANLSDLAAMGARPVGLTIGLSLPGTVPVAWVEALYQGMAACAAAYGTAIVGGDICRSPVVTLGVTALGQVHPQRVLRRSAAQVGDAIVVTGEHGASRAGLERLLSPDDPCPLSVSQQHRLIQAHQRPRPRLDILPLLEAVGAWQLDRPIAAMDSSDGLADAVLQICQSSGVGAILERSRLPTPPELTPWRSAEQALNWTLYGGEDFELVLCLPEATALALVAQSPGAAIIGYTTPALDLVVGDCSPSDKSSPGDASYLSLRQGFQHFDEA